MMGQWLTCRRQRLQGTADTAGNKQTNKIMTACMQLWETAAQPACTHTAPHLPSSQVVMADRKSTTGVVSRRVARIQHTSLVPTPLLPCSLSTNHF